jgi:hypothetical protein
MHAAYELVVVKNRAAVEVPMVIYTVTRGNSEASSKMTVHVEGKVTLDNWESLRGFCLDALKTSENLVLNLENISEYDFSLSVFICLLRRAVQVQGKQLTVFGRMEEFVCLYSNGEKCSFTMQNTRCLCENLFARTTAS